MAVKCFIDDGGSLKDIDDFVLLTTKVYILGNIDLETGAEEFLNMSKAS